MGKRNKNKIKLGKIKQMYEKKFNFSDCYL